MKLFAVLVVVLAVVLSLLEARSVKTNSQDLRDLRSILKRILKRQGGGGVEDNQQPEVENESSFNETDVNAGENVDNNEVQDYTADQENNKKNAVNNTVVPGSETSGHRNNNAGKKIKNGGKGSISGAEVNNNGGQTNKNAGQENNNGGKEVNNGGKGDINEGHAQLKGGHENDNEGKENNNGGTEVDSGGQGNINEGVKINFGGHGNNKSPGKFQGTKRALQRLLLDALEKASNEL